MPQAWEIWNKTHDVAVVYWDRRPSDFPLTPVNDVLMKFYNQEPSIYPFFYAVWHDGTEIGLLITGSMSLPEEDAELVLFAMLNEIVDSEKLVAETNPIYEMRVYDA